MALKFKFPGSIPFWMFDTKNFQLIVSKSIPLSVNDNKAIVYAEVSVPGGSTSDLNFASMNSEEHSFSLRIANFNESVGNSLLMAQSRNLRRQGGALDVALNPFGKRSFTSNPPVLMWWGTGKFTPLFFKVTEMGFNHQNHNRFGFPQVTDVSIKVRLDESGVLFALEDTFTKVASYGGMAQALLKLFSSTNPYKGVL